MRYRLRDPDAAIEIIANPQHDGCCYGLHPRSKRALCARYPQVVIAPALFVGYETKAEFEQLHGHMWDPIVKLLTGLAIPRLQALGGVYILDVPRDRVVFDTRPADVAPQLHA